MLLRCVGYIYPRDMYITPIRELQAQGSIILIATTYNEMLPLLGNSRSFIGRLYQADASRSEHSCAIAAKVDSDGLISVLSRLAVCLSMNAPGWKEVRKRLCFFSTSICIPV
jgi:hypothetical protein